MVMFWKLVAVIWLCSGSWWSWHQEAGADWCMEGIWGDKICIKVVCVKTETKTTISDGTHQ